MRYPPLGLASGQESRWCSQSAIWHCELHHVAWLHREQRNAIRPAQPGMEHFVGSALTAGDAGVAARQERLWSSQSSRWHSVVQYVAPLQRGQGCTSCSGRAVQPGLEHCWGTALAAGDAAVRLQVVLCERQSSF